MLIVMVYYVCVVNFTFCVSSLVVAMEFVSLLRLVCLIISMVFYVFWSLNECTKL